MNFTQEQIDAALDRVLRSSGSALKNYTLPYNIERMRLTMQAVMTESFNAGRDFAAPNSEPNP